MPDKTTERSLTIEDLSQLREKTESVAQFFEGQLRRYLDTLRPLFAPRRLLGRHVGAKDDVPGSDRALAQVQEKYREVCRQPFGLPPELPEDFLGHLDNRPEIYPLEYTHVAKNVKESKGLTITSPGQWILTYRSDYTLGQFRKTVIGKSERRAASVRDFVVDAIAMHLFLQAFPNLTQLLADLRYDVQMETLTGLGDLQCVIIRSCLPSFRPSDELLLTATRFSGVPAFIELIDLDATRSLQDPLKSRLEHMLS